MKVIYSDKFLDRISVFMKVGGITLFPFVIIRDKYKKEGTARRERVIRHESIHIEQQKELLVIPFYVIYVLEYIVKAFVYKFDIKKAYRNISFEREAFGNDTNMEYLKSRKRYNWIKLIF